MLMHAHVLESFARYVAPELGWVPATEGPATGYTREELSAYGV
ncbi:hypothetical protein [Helcobacillus massiliensis]|uniref:Uncharacterized protein n=1 Tax=Helcobacillus massiliensis TaxID=521392 RepID=A0A839QVW9_9MICO|nr:hypothetical protein [Helcobacillus massiliensis]MBB3023855.1 hypothetical protein [Helcobacillus massiliensis]MDK7741398.1 hypothetical protein [Helcobacillus massiliensis]WOO92755.1 hypothetical protein R3I40_10135 [Helcobacillus massiliensis]